MKAKKYWISMVGAVVLVLWPLIPGCELKSASLVGPFVEIPLYEAPESLAIGMSREEVNNIIRDLALISVRMHMPLKPYRRQEGGRIVEGFEEGPKILIWEYAGKGHRYEFHYEDDKLIGYYIDGQPILKK